VELKLNFNSFIKSFMKNIERILLIGLSGLAFAACSDNFFEKQPNAHISPEQLQKNAVWNPNILLGQAAGISATSFAWGTGGTDGHDDFGQKSIDIATDLMSGDMVMAGETYGWFSADSRLLNNTKDKNRDYMIWRYYFQIIKAANSIFDTVGGDEEAPEGEDNQLYYGQAKALRAYAYFNLVNLYARPYSVAANEPAVPVYRSQLTAETAPLSTVEQVYAFIIKDLTDAIAVLDEVLQGAHGPNKGAPDADVARGLLAYAYLSKGEYGLAASTALEVISRGNYPLMTKTEIIESGFRSVNIPAFMWAIDLTKDNSPALPTFWGHVDYFTYSYCAAGDYKMIPDNLYAQIPDTDERKKWFRSSAPMMNWYKFYDTARKAMGDRLWENDEVYMRVDEMYLIAAEASIRNNDSSTAISVLEQFLAERDETVAATVKDMNVTQLLDLLYFNWRVEMWGEGRGLLTMKRFKQTVTRGGNDFAYPGQSFGYDDARFYFEIPEREQLNNPNIN
jgi:hypothetical protein